MGGGMHVTLDTKGLEDYIRKIERVGGNADKAVENALDKAADFLLEEMRSRVEPHKFKGRALRAVKRREVKVGHTAAYVEVGALDIRREDKDGFHVVYQEYGSPGKFAADPWLAPALEKKAQVRKIMRDTLKEAGVPVE